MAAILGANLDVLGYPEPPSDAVYPPYTNDVRTLSDEVACGRLLQYNSRTNSFVGLDFMKLAESGDSVSFDTLDDAIRIWDQLEVGNLELVSLISNCEGDSSGTSGLILFLLLPGF